MGTTPTTGIDWSKPQRCVDCGRLMRPGNTSAGDPRWSGRLRHAGHGRCKTCYDHFHYEPHTAAPVVERHPSLEVRSVERVAVLTWPLEQTAVRDVEKRHAVTWARRELEHLGWYMTTKPRWAAPVYQEHTSLSATFRVRPAGVNIR